MLLTIESWTKLALQDLQVFSPSVPTRLLDATDPQTPARRGKHPKRVLTVSKRPAKLVASARCRWTHEAVQPLQDAASGVSRSRPRYAHGGQRGGQLYWIFMKQTTRQRTTLRTLGSFGRCRFGVFLRFDDFDSSTQGSSSSSPWALERIAPRPTSNVRHGSRHVVLAGRAARGARLGWAKRGRAAAAMQGSQRAAAAADDFWPTGPGEGWLSSAGTPRI